MFKKKAFISFDWSYDEPYKKLLEEQLKSPSSLFEPAGHSQKTSVNFGWEKEMEDRIGSSHVMIVLCGMYADKAHHMDAEIRIAQKKGVPYFLLAARPKRYHKRPLSAKPADDVYSWTFENLKMLLEGNR